MVAFATNATEQPVAEQSKAVSLTTTGKLQSAAEKFSIDSSGMTDEQLKAAIVEYKEDL